MGCCLFHDNQNATIVVYFVDKAKGSSYRVSDMCEVFIPLLHFHMCF